MAATTPGKDPLLFNKISGAVLGTLLFVMGLNIGAEGIFHSPKPAVPGYDLPAAEEHAAGASDKPVEVAPIADRLAKADPAKGENVAKQCLSCHSFKPDGAGAQNGPHLFGVFERAKGSTSFSGYSAPMKTHTAEKWTAEDLDKFLANPKAAVPGTAMAFNGVTNPDRRAELIAYLEKLK
ncbi:c-type cytochrome [Terrarubrum flagellatum]|uniref:c-type cytochrome n=1 Tax=Terrirubrum flagellatum TaxID=2895980 RepID=UPI003144F8A8